MSATTKRANLRSAAERISSHMDDILDLFAKGAVITVVVRHPDYPDCECVMTNDDLNAVADLIKKVKAEGKLIPPDGKRPH